MKRWLPVTCGVLLLVGGVIYMTANGWLSAAKKSDDTVYPTLRTNAPSKEGGFASDRDPQLGKKQIKFDGERAMGYLKAICDLGPRMSGTPSMGFQQELIRKHFEQLEANVTFQTFSAKQASRKTVVTMSNIIVSFHTFRKRRVIICSHYDTRPIADQEPDPRNWRKPFVSANDGGSGVAFLMEYGRHIKDIPTKVGIDFVFFDGEEYIWNRDRDKYFIGSKHFANEWKKKGRKREDYAGAVLLDMIAGKNAKFPAERYSWLREPKFVQQIWTIAGQLNCETFENKITKRGVLDDHIALLDVGIPAIDIIDFNYPHWHRLADTPENCSPKGMIDVAKVLTHWLQVVE